jgi:hypothetical protein
LKKPVFSKRDLLRWKVPARLNWDSILPCSQLHFGKVQWKTIFHIILKIHCAKREKLFGMKFWTQFNHIFNYETRHFFSGEILTRSKI